MMRPRPHQMTKNEWIEEHRLNPSLSVNDALLEQDPFDDDSYKTVILDDFIQTVDNPILHIQKASRVAKDKVLIVVPDSKRSKSTDDSKRDYTGRSLFDQCMKAGLEDRQIKIDHLNEFPNVYWLATCSN